MVCNPCSSCALRVVASGDLQALALKKQRESGRLYIRFSQRGAHAAQLSAQTPEYYAVKLALERPHRRLVAFEFVRTYNESRLYPRMSFYSTLTFLLVHGLL
jgi:hypothetical protein